MLFTFLLLCFHETYAYDLQINPANQNNFVYDNNFESYEERGIITGIITSNGKPLQKCQVKIYKLERKGSLLFKRYFQTDFHETITDNNGNYKFKDIPEGDYKLYWKKSLGEPWTKRIETEPDIIVKKGQITAPCIIDIEKG